MAVAAEYRIPHSQFLSWSEPDRDKAIWHYIRERSRCSECGTRPEEWDETQGGHRHAWQPALRRCRGCELMQARRDSLQGENLGRGIHIVWERGVSRGGDPGA